MTRHGKPARDGGFSLVEVMVTVAILAMVSTLAFSSLRFGARVWDRSAPAETLVRIDAVGARLVSLIQRAVLPPIQGSNFAVRVPLLGDSRQLRFLTVEPGGPAGGGLTAWHLSSERFDKELALIVRRLPVSSPAVIFEKVDWPAPLLVLDGLSGVEFSYISDVAADQRQSRWEPGPVPPALIVMSVTAGAHRHDIVARPAIQP